MFEYKEKGKERKREKRGKEMRGKERKRRSCHRLLSGSFSGEWPDRSNSFVLEREVWVMEQPGDDVLQSRRMHVGKCAVSDRAFYSNRSCILRGQGVM